MGFYSSDTADVLSKHHAQINKTGFEYLLVDDTKLVIVNKYHIDKNIKAPFNTTEELPKNKRIKIALVIGGELWMARSLSAQNNAANYVFREFAKSQCLTCRPRLHYLARQYGVTVTGARSLIGICKSPRLTQLCVEA